MRRPLARALALLLLLALRAGTASAQQRTERFVAHPQPQPIERTVVVPDSTGQRSTLRLAAGGLLGGAIGGIALGAAGLRLACGSEPVEAPESDFCGLAVLPGFLLGEMIGMPLGVNWANDWQGSFGYDALASLASIIVGGGLLVLTAEAAPIVAPFVIAGQLAAIILVERATADDDESEDDAPGEPGEDPDFGYEE